MTLGILCLQSVDKLSTRIYSISMPKGIYTRTQKHTDMLKGRVPWNKGKKGVYSKESLEKMSRGHKGKKLTEEHKENISKSAPKGERHPGWKGGRTIRKVGDGYGYVLIRMPSHPNAAGNGYVREHRLVMEKKLGRYLTKDEVVHHINGIKNDNRPENLALYHTNLYGKHMKRVKCPECGCKF